VVTPAETFGAAGPSHSGSFLSHARGRRVGYTIAWPPGHAPGDVLPLAVLMHGFGGDHTSGFGATSLAQALAVRPGGRRLPPLALVAVNGGGLYWNAHPGDDPMAMIVDELVPMCRALGLGATARASTQSGSTLSGVAARIGAIGISMGGYGAVLLAEKHPDLVGAVAAISPAVWTGYDQARAANPGAFASARAFRDDDVITHASALRGLPVRIASGDSDPFHPGVVALARALPRSAVVEFLPGCHDGSFFASQTGPSLAFMAHHLMPSP
jgi:pimeloyl-ACP methyl ester carboxylesterase